MNDSLTEVVRSAVAQHLDIEPSLVRSWHRFERDLGLHPLDVILIALELEEIEEVELPIDHLDELRTVAELTVLLRSMVRKNSAEHGTSGSMRLGRRQNASRSMTRGDHG